MYREFFPRWRELLCVCVFIFFNLNFTYNSIYRFLILPCALWSLGVGAGAAAGGGAAHNLFSCYLGSMLMCVYFLLALLICFRKLRKWTFLPRDSPTC